MTAQAVVADFVARSTMVRRDIVEMPAAAGSGHSAGPRGSIGVADLSSAVLHGGPPRAAGDLAPHVLEALRFAPSVPLMMGVVIGAVDLDG